MSPTELKKYKDDLIQKKWVTESEYVKLLAESEERHAEQHNIQLSEEEKKRINAVKTQFQSSTSPVAPIKMNNSTNNAYHRPENYDLAADIIHDKEEQLRLRHLQQQELEHARLVSGSIYEEKLKKQHTQTKSTMENENIEDITKAATQAKTLFKQMEKKKKKMGK